MDNKTITWVNGRQTGEIDVFDRGLAFGDGLFETMAVRQGCIALRDLHLQRLTRSAERLGLAYREADIEQDLATVLAHIASLDDAAEQTWRFKYQLTRGSSNSGYMAASAITVNRIAQLSLFTRPVADLQQQGVTVRYCDWPLSQQTATAGMKTLNRLDQVMARKEWQCSAIFEGLMANQQGEWVEGTMSNLFAVNADGEVLTPPLHDCGVEGVMRRHVIENLCAAHDIPMHETVLGQLEQYPELFLTNALIGIVPIKRVGQHPLTIGPVTRRLQHALHDLNG